MITENQAQSPREWAVEHFGGSELDNVKRVGLCGGRSRACRRSPRLATLSQK